MIEMYRGEALMTRVFAMLHAQALGPDEDGLSILAYAFGAVFILVPMAAALYFFGTSTANEASAIVDNAIAP